MEGFATRWLTCVVVLLGFAPAPFTRPASSLDVPAAAAAPFAGARATPAQALPGRRTRVDLTVRETKEEWVISTCAVRFDGQDAVECVAIDGRSASVSVDVPESGELHWEMTFTRGGIATVKPPAVLRVEPPAPESGIVPFTVLRVDGTTDPGIAEPGRPLDVTLAVNDAAVGLTDCHATFAGVTGECAPEAATTRTVRIVVPQDAPRGRQLTLTWTFTLRRDGEDFDKGDGHLRVWVAVAPPRFDVTPSTAQPGLPLVVTFRSGTTGVTVDTCALTYRGAAGCGAGHTAVLIVPATARVGGILRIPWTLTYRSTRPNEKPGSAAGTLDVEVVAVPVHFTVTAQPGSGYPGDEVTLTIGPAVPGVTIVRCLGFFPNQPGDTCQATDERWLVHTVVPDGTPAGATLLRWGVASVNEAGEPLVDDGDLPFEVLRKTGTTKSPTVAPATTPPILPSLPVRDPSPAGKGGAPRPEFVARTEPEVAKPGQAVRVTITAVTPGTTVTGCRAAFDGGRIARCDGVGGRWTAMLRVPRSAEPGDLPLLWDVTSGAGAGQGTIAYRVLDRERADPQFGAAVEPASVRPGQHVRVTHRSYAGGPAITGCNAGIAPGGVLAACTRTPRGWVTDVVVPEGAPRGIATLLWQVTYAGQAGPGTADGRTGIGVLAAEEEHESWWQKLWRMVWKSGAVALVGVVLIGGRTVLRRWSGRTRRDAGSTSLPAGVAVVAVLPAGPVAVSPGNPGAAPRRVVRLVVRHPPPAVHDLMEPP
ncbi:hypothetical protein ACTOB_007048 [Actinoplanes oblitus]|uniref:Uncharacterized protein n=1 Tax=Actinoplanes oblitus TaxID=3040509 RepID=A0ABY8WBY0_9ACTN|nr:hypothetical protein [Actinoplanes oblitus]WIM94987.1 hypothetical protein ACTOB_007048 [Actinoplanes oblitus]